MKEGQEMVAERGKRKEKATNVIQTTTIKELSSAMSTTSAVSDTTPMINITKTQAATIRTLNLTVNGREHVIQVEPNWPLRDVLRQKLGLTSIKDFCNGYGACGSCTVIMNGRPVLSCMILAVECEGSVIETVEGISDAKHPLIEAYIMNWAAQCGYCTPGFIVTAKALLDHNQNPTVDEIKEALSGNLCRCGSYPVHIKAVQDAARILRGEK
jgi:aerobic carbon-monoxide dehydrogenase small subunit